MQEKASELELEVPLLLNASNCGFWMGVFAWLTDKVEVEGIDF